MGTVRLSENVAFYVPLTRSDPHEKIVEGYCYCSPRVRGDKWNLTRAALEGAAKEYMKAPAIRVMHQPIAAGKGLSVKFDDKGCLLRAYISDDREWQKVVDGVYRGFSIGGRPRVARGCDIHVFDWLETSLVDRPSDSEAKFTMVRADSPTGEYDVVVLGSDDLQRMVEMDTEVYGEEQVRRAASAGRPVKKAAPNDEEGSEETVEDDMATEGEEDEEAEGAMDEDPKPDKKRANRGDIDVPELARYSPDQPRDEGGKWSIISGHSARATGAKINKGHIDAIADDMELSKAARNALHKAHDKGLIVNDHHLYRTIGASEGHMSVSHGKTHGGIINAAVKLHGKGGTHEGKRWTGDMPAEQKVSKKSVKRIDAEMTFLRGMESGDIPVRENLESKTFNDVVGDVEAEASNNKLSNGAWRLFGLLRTGSTADARRSVDQFADWLHSWIDEELPAVQAQARKALARMDGGNTDDGVVRRLADTESELTVARSEVEALKAGLSEVKEEVSRLRSVKMPGRQAVMYPSAFERTITDPTQDPQEASTGGRRDALTKERDELVARCQGAEIMQHERNRAAARIMAINSELARLD